MRRLLARLLPLAVAATAAAALPAATSAAGPVFAPAAHPITAATAHRAGWNINGFNWGGYAATGGGFTSVSASWTEPAATCNSTNDLYAPWVGIDGYGSSTVEQTGVQTDCSSGRPVDSFWYEMYPANPVYPSPASHPVTAGDHITASVTASGSTFTLTLSNTSRGWTYTTNKSLTSARKYSAEVIIESPTGAYPNFGTLSFTSATVNGGTLGSHAPTALDPSNNQGYEAHASTLSGGTAFTMTYLHE